MPELPDLIVYLDCIRERLQGQRLKELRIGKPFVLRSVEPPCSAFVGAELSTVSRVGKRIVMEFEGARYVLIHLMIAGRLRWRNSATSLPKGNGLAAFDFPAGTLMLTEAGKKRRASLHLVQGESGLRSFDRGGLEVMEADLDAFAQALRRDNHTLKRALTDQSVLSGIGNAYSDEILHRAKLSPFRQTRMLNDEEMQRLHKSSIAVLSEWVERLRAETGVGFPEKVTAFREGMAVHGRFGQPCPECHSEIQRIVYTDREANYCARCQTGGRLLADRALSRLLKANWPRTLEELESEKP